MDIWKYFHVTHARHVLCNPLTVEKADELLARCDLADGARVVDIACGKGEVLVRSAEQHRIHGVGVDISPFAIADARARAAARVPGADLTWICGPGAEWAAEAPASYDVAMCWGAEFVYGGLDATLRALRTMVRPRGLVMVGAPFWRRPPAPEYLAAEGMAADAFRDSTAANAAVAAALGLELVALVTSSGDDWDRYESLQWLAVDAYGAAHPDDPDLPEIRRRSAAARDVYLRWGRDTLAWAMYLLRV